MFKHLVGLCVILCLPAAAVAQAAECGQRDQVVERLASRYSERLTAGGLQETDSTQSVIEVWASTETGTFTVLLTNPDGIACIVAAGTNFFGPPSAPAARGVAG